jgi:hypothetical protein
VITSALRTQLILHAERSDDLFARHVEDFFQLEIHEKALSQPPLSA